MINLAGVCYARNKTPVEYKKFGSLWYDEKRHSACLFLQGFRYGQFMAKPYKEIENPPFLDGEIQVWTKVYGGTSGASKEYLWCGWVWTCSNQEGCIYNGILEIDPWPVLKDSGNERGIYMQIHLGDK